MEFFICTFFPLFFSWAVPIMICSVLWRKNAPEKPSKLLLFGLFPVAFFSMAFGFRLVQAIFPDFFATQGFDRPGPYMVIILPLMLIWTYIPIIKYLARIKRGGHLRKKIVFILILRIVEIITWVPISIGMTFTLTAVYGLVYYPINMFDFNMFDPVWMIIYVPIITILIPIGLRKWRRSLEKNISILNSSKV